MGVSAAAGGAREVLLFLELDRSSGVELVSKAHFVGLLVRLPVKTCALQASTSFQYDDDMAVLLPIKRRVSML